MSSVSMCRCCMLRPPDRNLKSPYTTLGKSEVYADMLKDCFEIHLTVNDVESEGGICEVCITRLRDACDFKLQVQRCQKHMQPQDTLIVKDEMTPKVKTEISEDEDNGMYFLGKYYEDNTYTYL